MDSRTEIEKIGRIGEEMDGNASQSEEELFVEELGEQIPIVLDNIGTTLEQIDFLETNELKPNIAHQQIQEISSKVD